MDSLDLAPVTPKRSADFTSNRIKAVLAKARAVVADRSKDSLTLLSLDDALAAFGENGVIDLGEKDVPVDEIVGTVGRTRDFDRRFRPLNPRLHARWQGIARAVARGVEMPPIDLVLLGEMYFVRDGHHRVSVARAFSWPTIRARVQRICTVAYAMGCLTHGNLPSKAAERLFLERVPLPDPVRIELWLDNPTDWMRLADAAEAWGFRQTVGGRTFSGRQEFAAAWWAEEVEPTIAQLRTRGVGTQLRDVQAYVRAIQSRDTLGQVPA